MDNHISRENTAVRSTRRGVWLPEMTGVFASGEALEAQAMLSWRALARVQFRACQAILVKGLSALADADDVKSAAVATQMILKALAGMHEATKYP